MAVSTAGFQRQRGEGERKLTSYNGEPEKFAQVVADYLNQNQIVSASVVVNDGRIEQVRFLLQSGLAICFRAETLEIALSYPEPVSRRMK